jgi:hypothetical protein
MTKSKLIISISTKYSTPILYRKYSKLLTEILTPKCKQPKNLSESHLYNNLHYLQYKMGICGSRPSETLPLPTNPGEEVIRTVTSIRESFILIKSLGSGSFGNVFLVKDKRTGLERAAKELTKSNINERIAPEIYSELMVMKGLVIPI